MQSCSLNVVYAGTTVDTISFTLGSAALTAAQTGWQTTSVTIDNAAASGALSFSYLCTSSLTSSFTLDLALDEVYLTNN